MEEHGRRDEVQQLQRRLARLAECGGAERVARQHAAGKLTARERLALLFDDDSFEETRAFVKHRCTAFGMEHQSVPAEGVVTGSGEVAGRRIYAFSQDFTCMGGSVGEAHADKIVATMTDALRFGAPVVGINDSGGARIQEGVDALSGYGRIFNANTLLSGVVPQISIIAGPCAGGAAYSPALTDFVIMVRGSARMFIAGPGVIRAATGEVIDEEALGGADAHMAISGNVHFVADDDRHALDITKRLLQFLPSNNLQEAPPSPASGPVDDDPLMETLIPESARAAYDMRSIIARLVDEGDFLEVQSGYAQNLVVGFARIGGLAVGLVANQPQHMAGVLDIDASDKGARFIRFCNVFNIPLVSLVDVPGFLPGVSQEHGGIIRHGAKLLFAWSAATVPKLTVILRKAYGGAFLAMCSRDLGADRVWAWPTAEIAVMGAEGAARSVFRREIAAAADPEAALQERIQAYRREFANPYLAAERGHIDGVIDPAHTRRILANALRSFQAKRDRRPPKKHGNIPL